MHATLELAAFWLVAFLTLSAAVVVLSIFCDVVESDMELLSFGKEAVVAGFASLIEAATLWLIVLFIPVETRGLALRAMVIPIMIVGLIYMIAHFETWSIFETVLLLAFQLVIGCMMATLLSGHFGAAVVILLMFGAFMAAIGVIARSLWG